MIHIEVKIKLIEALKEKVFSTKCIARQINRQSRDKPMAIIGKNASCKLASQTSLTNKKKDFAFKNICS